MNNKIKHVYSNYIIKNIKNDIRKSTLAKFFNYKNIFNSNVIFLENNTEIDIQYINYLKKRKIIKNNKKIIKFKKNKKNNKFKQNKYMNVIDKTKISLCLSNLCIKKVNVIENKINKKTMNAQILAKIIAKKLKKNRFTKIKKTIKKYVHFMEEKHVVNRYVTGLKICVNGRLNKDRIVPRKTRNSFFKGRFKQCTFIDKAHIYAKSKKGQYEITVIIGIKVNLNYKKNPFYFL